MHLLLSITESCPLYGMSLKRGFTVPTSLWCHLYIIAQCWQFEFRLLILVCITLYIFRAQSKLMSLRQEFHLAKQRNLFIEYSMHPVLDEDAILQ